MIRSGYIFSKFLKNKRLKLGISQRAFAERIGISEQALINIEKGSEAISFSTIDKICNSLSIRPETLFSEEISQTDDEKSVVEKINGKIKKLELNNLKILFSLIEALEKYK